MKCIELLFIAYFTNTNEEALAKDALNIYNVVKSIENK